MSRKKTTFAFAMGAMVVMFSSWASAQDENTAWSLDVETSGVEGSEWEAMATLTCPDGKTVIETVNCPPGEVIVATAACGDETFEKVLVCPAAASMTGVSGLRLGLSANGFWTGVFDAEDLSGVEGQFEGNLRVSENWSFAFQTGPGFALSQESLTISTLVGASYRLGSTTALRVGPRHRVAFLTGDDLSNSLLLEGQLGWKFGENITARFFVGIGAIWIQQTKGAGKETNAERIVLGNDGGVVTGTSSSTKLERFTAYTGGFGLHYQF